MPAIEVPLPPTTLAKRKAASVAAARIVAAAAVAARNFLRITLAPSVTQKVLNRNSSFRLSSISLWAPTSLIKGKSARLASPAVGLCPYL